MKPVLIGLYSPVPQSGKSTVAAHLALNHGFQVVKFAQVLKMMTATFLRSLGYEASDIAEMVEGDRKEEVIPAIGVSTRHLMITLGTDWGRNAVAEDLWVKAAMTQAHYLLGQGCNVVIDDMRFPNEMNAIICGYPASATIRIERPDVQSTAASEGLLEGMTFDAHFVNDGDLRDLLNKMDDFLARLHAAVQAWG
ncbi:hypothetical protein AB6806_23830 [Bosea sp. RCC_152_1]|uniref:deoxynucleotide monophosphate kinase family protein n=1 Tax=Bosea sp. RCC_152_1 TaxID=3239228 RepID=UPI003523CB21